MTPAEHVTAAEKALDKATAAAGQGMTETARVYALIGMGHAQVAHAVEAGVPHGATAPAKS